MTGRRVADRLTTSGRPVRIGSRSGHPAFDWDDESTWEPSLQGVGAAYLTYPTDLGLPGAAERVKAFAAAAIGSGARRLVLLSGRGQHSHAPAEQAVQESGAAWAIVRSAWFTQNFSEGFLAPMVAAGELALPAGEAVEPFVDAEDVAEVAVAALVDDRHVGQVHEVTGPLPLRFAEVTNLITAATGRPVRYHSIDDEQFTAGMAEDGLPADLVAVLIQVFADLREGGNASTTDGVERALGRPPRGMADFVRSAAAAGVWGTS